MTTATIVKQNKLPVVGRPPHRSLPAGRQIGLPAQRLHAFASAGHHGKEPAASAAEIGR